ncbi:MAG: hypothetical protein ACOYNO_13275 [Saprospiraceae bacterium]
MKHTFFLLLAAIVLTCCASQPPKAKMTLDVYWRYLVENGQGHVETTFSAQKTPDAKPLPVQLPNPPSFMNDAMRLRPVQGITYLLDKTHGFETNALLTWSDQEGSAHSLPLKMEELYKINFTPAMLSHRTASRFQWTGAPLGPSETLLFMWENAQKRETLPMEIIGAPGSTGIDFPAAQIAKLSPGKWTLYVVRKKIERGEAGDTAYEAVIEYFTPSIVVEVTP